MSDQLGLDLGEPETPVYVSTHPVRLDLHAQLDALKAATDTVPWDEATTKHYRTMFPIRAKVLPPEEARFLWRQFEFQLRRLGAVTDS